MQNQRNLLNYYINPETNNPGSNNEVHNEKCHLVQDITDNLILLGSFTKPQAALVEAKKHYPKADGCSICNPDIHTQ